MKIKHSWENIVDLVIDHFPNLFGKTIVLPPLGYLKSDLWLQSRLVTAVQTSDYSTDLWL